MKDYIKPTFILAGLAPVALAVMSCDYKYKGAELEAIYSNMGYYTDEERNNTFAYNESCEYPVPEAYCKFTAVESGNIQALTS